MVKNKFISTKAIVLNRQNYKEADKILQLITPMGRISAIAKGARREKSKLAGGIQLFAVNDVTFLQGRSEMFTLTSSRLEIFYENIIKNYDRMQLGYEMIKIVYNNSGSIDSEQWFYILKESLANLNNLDIDPRLVETWFYLRFSELLGYEMGLHYDTEGKKIIEDKTYSYNISEKGLTLSSKGEIEANHIKLMRILMAHPIAVAGQISGVNKIINECLMIARAHAGT